MPTTEPRAWSVTELAPGDARGLTGRKPRTAAEGTRHLTVVPEQPSSNIDAWATTDDRTRDLLREIGRLGYSEAREGIGGAVLVEGVGDAYLTLILVGDIDADGVHVARVVFGGTDWTPRQMTLWLRKRAAR